MGVLVMRANISSAAAGQPARQSVFTRIGFFWDHGRLTAALNVDTVSVIPERSLTMSVSSLSLLQVSSQLRISRLAMMTSARPRLLFGV